MIGVVTMHELPPDSPTRKWSSVDTPVSGFGSHHIGQSSSLGGHPPGSFLARNYAAHDMQLKQLKGETGALRAMTELAEERSKEMIKQKDEAVNERGRVMETLAIQQEQSRQHAIEWEAKRKRLEGEARELRAAIEGADERRRTMEGERDAALDRMKRAEGSLTAAMAECEREGERAAMTERRLRDEIAAVAVKLEAAQERVDDLQLQREAARGETSRVCEQLAQAQLDERKAAEQLAVMAAERRGADELHRRTLESMGEEIVTLKRRDEEADARVREATEKLHEAQTETRRLTEQHATTAAELRSAVDQAKRLGEYTEQLRNEGRAAAARAGEQEASLNELRALRDNLAAEKSRALEDLAVANAERKHLQQSLVRNEAALKQAHTDKANALARAGAAEEQARDFLGQRDAARAEAAKTREEKAIEDAARAAAEEARRRADEAGGEVRRKDAAATEAKLRRADELQAVHDELQAKLLASHEALILAERGRTEALERAAALAAEKRAADDAGKKTERALDEERASVAAHAEALNQRVAAAEAERQRANLAASDASEEIAKMTIEKKQADELCHRLEELVANLRGKDNMNAERAKELEAKLAAEVEATHQAAAESAKAAEALAVLQAEAKAASALAKQREEHLQSELDEMRGRADRADLVATANDERRRQEAEQKARAQVRLVDCEAELRHTRETLRVTEDENRGLQEITSHIAQLTRAPRLMITTEAAGTAVEDAAAIAIKAAARRSVSPNPSPPQYAEDDDLRAAARANSMFTPGAGAHYGHSPASRRPSPYTK